MKTSDFDYELPAELIAQQPLTDRTASRMTAGKFPSNVTANGFFFNVRRNPCGT